MRKLSTLLVVGALALGVAATSSANILPSNARVHGADLGDWAKRFFEFDAAIPVVGNSHPAIDEGAVDCSLGQQGKVWFLETAPGFEGAFERSCTVPVGTRLYVPVWQWVCSPDLDDVPVDPCLDEADDVFAQLELGLSVDGKQLDTAALGAYRATTGRFELGLAEDSIWEFFTGRELGSSIDFGAEAIGALVGPLSAGEHTIVVTFGSSTLGGGFGGSLTYRLTVTPKGKG